MRFYLPTLIFLTCVQHLAAQHNLEFGAGGLFPIAGYKATEYSTGPDLHACYEFHFQKYFAAEAGWTGAWTPGTSCDRFGCIHPTYELKLLDYGLRGILPLAAGRVELSVGVGGGYIWYPKESNDSYSTVRSCNIQARERSLSIAASGFESDLL